MRFPCHRVLEDVPSPLTDTLGAKGALAALALDHDLGFYDAQDRIGRAQNFPGQASELPGEDLAESVHLLGARGGLDHADGLAITLVDGFRPGQDAGPLDPGQPPPAAGPTLEVPSPDSPQAPALWVGEAS